MNFAYFGFPTGKNWFSLIAGELQFISGGTEVLLTKCSYAQVLPTALITNIALRSTISAIGRLTQEQDPTHVLYPVVNFLCDVHNEHWHDAGESKSVAVKNLFSLLMSFPKYLVTQVRKIDFVGNQQNVLLRDFINKLFELGVHSTLGVYADETLVQLCRTLGKAETEMTVPRMAEILNHLLMDRPST